MGNMIATISYDHSRTHNPFDTKVMLEGLSGNYDLSSDNNPQYLTNRQATFEVEISGLSLFLSHKKSEQRLKSFLYDAEHLLTKQGCSNIVTNVEYLPI